MNVYVMHVPHINIFVTELDYLPHILFQAILKIIVSNVDFTLPMRHNLFELQSDSNNWISRKGPSDFSDYAHKMKLPS